MYFLLGIAILMHGSALALDQEKDHSQAEDRINAAANAIEKTQSALIKAYSSELLGSSGCAALIFGAP